MSGRHQAARRDPFETAISASSSREAERKEETLTLQLTRSGPCDQRSRDAGFFKDGAGHCILIEFECAPSSSDEIKLIPLRKPVGFEAPWRPEGNLDFRREPETEGASLLSKAAPQVFDETRSRALAASKKKRRNPQMRKNQWSTPSNAKSNRTVNNRIQITFFVIGRYSHHPTGGN
jgi:hypothetical protein